MNRIDERSLRVVYNDKKKATFKELLDKDKAVSMHTRNLQILITEMFKLKKIGELPSIMHEIFQIEDSNNFNLRKNRGFKPANPSIMELKPFLFRTKIMNNFT